MRAVGIRFANLTSFLLLMTASLISAQANAQPDNAFIQADFVQADGVVSSSRNVAYGNRTSIDLRVIRSVESGTVVAEGDFLIEFDSAPLESARMEARMKIIEAETELELARANGETMVIEGQAGLQRAQSQVERIQLESAAVLGENGEISLRVSQLEREISFLQQKVDTLSQFVDTVGLDTQDRNELLLEITEAGYELDNAKETLNHLHERATPARRAQLEGQLEEAQLGVVLAERNLERCQLERRAILRVAESRIELFREHIVSLQRRMENCRVVAESNGTVFYNRELVDRKQNTLAGMVVIPGQTLLYGTDLEHMELTCSVPVREAQQLNPGMPAIVRIDAFDGEEFPATYASSGEIDPASGTVDVTVIIAASDSKLRPGMSGSVRIKVE
ncbi:MAG: efflux RND transporter periplasmic adaptor subunit [Planctomycetota bacterium]